MADFGNINEFRKTTQLRKINEDPTYLSFFFLFDFSDRERSPLLSGAAEDYLRNVVGDTVRADLLARFKKLLRKINTELPWFWQSVSGLETSRAYGTMEDPWRGAENPKIEIECLENIELTAFTLIDLYKRATYDFNRWVSVIPKNLCYFEMTIYVTEVRSFQQKTSDAFKDSRGNHGRIGDSQSNINPDLSVNIDMSVDAKPITVTKLGHCSFDIDSTNDIFKDLSKNPEMAKGKIGIFWKTTEEMKSVYGLNLNANQENTLVLEKEPNNIEPNNPFDPSNDTRRIGTDVNTDTINPLDKLKKRAKERVEGAVANVTNIADGLPGSNGSLGNAHGAFLSGQLAQLANSVTEAATARLFLGNVYGANTASNIQDAINSGSLNAIFNVAGQLFNRGSIDTSDTGDGNITPTNIHPETTISRSQGPINERVYQPGIDSSPDGNLNQNVYE